MPGRIFFIIPSFNGGENLINCLNSIGNDFNDIYHHSIVVVDNSSIDGSVNRINQLFPEVELIKR